MIDQTFYSLPERKQLGVLDREYPFEGEDVPECPLSDRERDNRRVFPLRHESCLLRIWGVVETFVDLNARFDPRLEGF